MSEPTHSSLVHDWETAGAAAPAMVAAPPGPRRIMLNDETLRDGLQSASATDPPIEDKLRLLHLMDGLGIDTACVGLPAAGARQQGDVEALVREIVASRLHIRANCAGRTLISDIRPMIEISQKIGLAVEVCVFTGSSPIRQYVEGWSINDLLRRTTEAVSFAIHEGMQVMYVTEDTTRSSPGHLRPLLAAAIDSGAQRVCLCDTVGAAVPAGTARLVGWVRETLRELGSDAGIDWHGHRDRGLGLANTLAAVEAGASRVHGTALGVGERAGNTAMEEILVNLRLMHRRDDDLSHLPEYAAAAAAALGVEVPASAPIVGRDAFRTATGVHAAALLKAQEKGDTWLADRIYSGVPAAWLGRSQEIEVGPMSGGSNASHVLRTLGLPHGAATVQAVLAAAKRSQRVLTDDEVRSAAADSGATASMVRRSDAKP